MQLVVAQLIFISTPSDTFGGNVRTFARIPFRSQRKSL